MKDFVRWVVLSGNARAIKKMEYFAFDIIGFLFE